MVFTTVTNIAFSIWACLVCGNPDKFIENLIFHGCARGTTYRANLYLQASTNMFTDLLFGVLPIPMLWESSMDIKQKTSVSLFLGMALMYV
jgi:hypothetical protein